MVVLTNLQVTAFYFAAALVLLERGQGVLAYPLGVSKMRGFLREIATEKGAWRSGRCSYWHFYRMHRLSAETKSRSTHLGSSP